MFQLFNGGIKAKQTNGHTTRKATIQTSLLRPARASIQILDCLSYFYNYVTNTVKLTQEGTRFVNPDQMLGTIGMVFFDSCMIIRYLLHVDIKQTS